jgi:hypothetical protein
MISTTQCRAIFSITEYIPKNCDGLEPQPVSGILCNKTVTGKLYKITLAYRFHVQKIGEEANPPRLSAYSCDPYQIYLGANTRETHCYPLEYVAVGFSNDANGTKQDDDKVPYYTCVLGEPRVYGWHQKDDGRYRVSLSRPHVNDAPGVLWSSIMKPENEDTMICSFILATGTFPYKTSFWDGKRMHSVLASGTGAFNFDWYGADPPAVPGLGWNVKISFGTVKRDIIPGGGMKTSIKNIKLDVLERLAIGNVLLTEALIRSKMRTPNFAGLPPSAPDQVNAAKISAVYKACRDSRALCYFQETEGACVHREKCHALVAIRDNSRGRDFNQLHFDLLSHHKEVPGVIIPVSPFGWVSLFHIHEMYLYRYVTVCTDFHISMQACRRYTGSHYGRVNFMFPPLAQAKVFTSVHKMSFLHQNLTPFEWCRNN